MPLGPNHFISNQINWVFDYFCRHARPRRDQVHALESGLLAGFAGHGLQTDYPSLKMPQMGDSRSAMKAMIRVTFTAAIRPQYTRGGSTNSRPRRCSTGRALRSTIRPLDPSKTG